MPSSSPITINAPGAREHAVVDALAQSRPRRDHLQCPQKVEVPDAS